MFSCCNFSAYIRFFVHVLIEMNVNISDAPFMNDIAVCKDGVIKLLKGLNPSKALGPDELHPRVLRS